MQQVDTVVLTNTSAKQVSIPLKQDALKSDTKLLVPIDPSALSDLGNAKTKLTVTVRAGSTTVQTDQSFDYTPKPSAPAKANPAAKANPSVSIAVSPQNPTVSVGKTQQFTATGISGTDSVTWSLNNIKGGNSNFGKISQTGLYTAPGKPGTVTITAKSVSDSSKSASTKVTIK